MASPSEEADAARARLELLRVTLERRIRSLALKLRSRDGELLRDEMVNAASVRAQVLAAIRAVGLQVEETLEERAARAAAAALKASSGARDGFAAEAGPELEAIVGGQTAGVAASFRWAHDIVRQSIDRGIATSARMEELIDVLAVTIDTSFLRASSAVDTAIIGAGRAVVVRQAERAGAEGGEEMVFRYIGPRGGNIRPFCKEHVGRVFTRAALDRLDNGKGQPKPVSVFCGGFGCRHSLAPLVRADLDEGVDVIE